MASKSLDKSGEFCVCFIEITNKVRNKALVENYTIIICVFRKKATVHYS